MFTVSDLLIKGTFSLALTSVVNVLSPGFSVTSLTPDENHYPLQHWLIE